MLTYFIKRLFWFIPTLFLISVCTFFLIRLSPGDPLIEIQNNDELDQWQIEEIISEKRNSLGLNEPYFYFSIFRKSASDTALRIHDSQIKNKLLGLAYQCGSWETINNYFNSLKIANKNGQISNTIYTELIQVETIGDLKNYLQEHQNEISKSTSLTHSINQIKYTSFSLNNYLLSFRFNGLNNQYHQWISAFLTGNWSYSIRNYELSKAKILNALKWTISLSILSIILSFFIAVPVGVYAANNPHKAITKGINALFTALYGVPNFWMATILLLLFASGQYLNWFPLFGIGEVSEKHSLLESIAIHAPYLVLPIICYSYGSLAYLYRHTSTSIANELKKDYIKTAYSKGLNSKSILWKHAFKNGSLPLITLIGGLLPALISGSFVIEYIFSIPGMGKLSIDSFLSRDYPVIFTISMLGACLTLIGVFLTDLIYHLLDPRIKLYKSGIS